MAASTFVANPKYVFTPSKVVSEEFEFKQSNLPRYSKSLAKDSFLRIPMNSDSSDFDDSELEKEKEEEATLSSSIKFQTTTENTFTSLQNLPKVLDLIKKIKNYKHLRILEIFGKMIIGEAERITKTLENNKASVKPDESTDDSPDSNFTYVGLITHAWPKGLGTQYPKSSASKSGCPSPSYSSVHDSGLDPSDFIGMHRIHSDSNEEEEAIKKRNSHRQKTKAMYWLDDNLIPLVDVYKRNSRYEVEIYRNVSISDSKYFPRLLYSDVESEGKFLFLRLLSVSSMTDFIEKYQKESFENRCSIVIKFLLDIMNGLQVLHSIGFVHSDVSPNNVGYDECKKNWNLFDFNQSLPISESLERPRKGGTEGFISDYASINGIFRPLDDYISLYYTCFDGFQSFLGQNQIENLLKPIASSLNIKDDVLAIEKFHQVIDKMYKQQL